MESLHDFVVGRLLESRGAWPAIATASGVPLRTLEKVARRESRNPKYETIDKLVRYFRDADAGAA